MRKAGEVTFTAAHQQKRNEGIAEFGNKESLERALDELDGSEIHGMKIRYEALHPPLPLLSFFLSFFSFTVSLSSTVFPLSDFFSGTWIHTSL